MVPMSHNITNKIRTEKFDNWVKNERLSYDIRKTIFFLINIHNAYINNEIANYIYF